MYSQKFIQREISTNYNTKYNIIMLMRSLEIIIENLNKRQTNLLTISNRLLYPPQLEQRNGFHCFC